jgi:hypothetical protein
VVGLQELSTGLNLRAFVGRLTKHCIWQKLQDEIAYATLTSTQFRKTAYDWLNARPRRLLVTGARRNAVEQAAP